MINFQNPWDPDVNPPEWMNNNNFIKSKFDNFFNGEKEELINSNIETTVINFSEKSIWCKNEYDSGVFEIQSGGSTNKSIDGLTHWSIPKQVFKVITGLDKLLGITVYDEGIGFNTTFWPIDKEINSALGGGWLKSPPDENWIPIFTKAGY